MYAQKQVEESVIYKMHENMSSEHIYSISKKDRKKLYEIIINDIGPFECVYGKLIKEIIKTSKTTDELYEKLSEPIVKEMGRTGKMMIGYIKKDIENYISMPVTSPPPLEAQLGI